MTTTDLDHWDPNTPAPWEQGDTGIDIKREEMSIPRLKIIGKEAVFENSATGEKLEVLNNAIVLGMTRGRSYWPKERDEEQKQPLCRSYDDVVGIPEESDEVAKRFHFPWKNSGVDRENLLAQDSTDDFGRVLIPCASCAFSKWDEVRRKPSPCALQYNIPLLYDDEQGQQQVAIFTAQKSSLGAFKRYLSSFEAAHKPSFYNYCTITLSAAKNGSVDYAVPQIAKGPATEPGENKEFHRFCYETLQGARALLTSIRAPRGADDDDDDTPMGGSDDNTNTPPPAAKSTAGRRTVSKPAAKKAAEPDIVDAEVVDPPEEPAAAAPEPEPTPEPTPEPEPEPEAPAANIIPDDDDMDF